MHISSAFLLRGPWLMVIPPPPQDWGVMKKFKYRPLVFEKLLVHAYAFLCRYWAENGRASQQPRSRDPPTAERGNSGTAGGGRHCQVGRPSRSTPEKNSGTAGEGRHYQVGRPTRFNR